MIGSALDKGLKLTSNSKNVCSQKMNKYSVHTVQMSGTENYLNYNLRSKYQIKL